MSSWGWVGSDSFYQMVLCELDVLYTLCIGHKHIDIKGLASWGM